MRENILGRACRCCLNSRPLLSLVTGFLLCFQIAPAQSVFDPDDFSYQFRVREVYQESRKYIDLDMNGNDEELYIKEHAEGTGRPFIIARRYAGPIIDQLNFLQSEWIRYGVAYDYNHDGDKDLFVVSREGDTLFANVVDVFHSRHSSLLQKFPLLWKPDSLEKLHDDVQVEICDVERIPALNTELMICMFHAGHSLRPRGIACYDPRTGRQLWSYLMGSAPVSVRMADVNGDNLPEIFVSTYAPDNGATFNGSSDDHSYIFGLSIQGVPLWKPKEMGGVFSQAFALPLQRPQDSKCRLYGMVSTGNQFANSSYIALLDPLTGVILGEPKILGDQLVLSNTGPPVFLSSGKLSFAVCLAGGEALLLDEGLQTVATRRFGSKILAMTNSCSLLDDQSEQFGVALASDHSLIVDEQLEPVCAIEGEIGSLAVRRGSTGERTTVITIGQKSLLGTMGSSPIQLRGWFLWMLLLFVSVAGSIGVFYGVRNILLPMKLYLTIFEKNSALGIMVLDRNEKVYHVNQALMDMFHTRKDLPPRTNWRQYFSPEIHTPFMNFISSSIKQVGIGREELIERIDLLQNGYPLYLRVQCDPVCVKNRCLGWLLQVGDLTQTVQSERLVNWALVARNLAHEMKTPLSTMWFTLERIRQQSEGTPNRNLIEPHLVSIAEEIRRVDNYVRGFMKLANVNPPNLQEVQLREFFGDLLSEYTRKLPTSVAIETDFEPDLPSVHIDVHLFTVAVTNLLDNAVNAVKGEGKIRLSAYLAQSLNGDFVYLSVLDSGCGISSDNLPKIFHPYFTTSDCGSGLGLVITKKIVEDHGGSIRFTTKEGVGTEFTIQLPKKLPAGRDIFD
jgi:signal transduction histidine kinase